MDACCVVLAHVTWVLAQEWALSIRAAKTVTWVLTLECALAQDTTVYAFSQATPLAKVEGVACLHGSSQSLESQSSFYSTIRNHLTTHSKPNLQYESYPTRNLNILV